MKEGHRESKKGNYYVPEWSWKKGKTKWTIPVPMRHCLTAEKEGKGLASRAAAVFVTMNNSVWNCSKIQIVALWSKWQKSRAKWIKKWVKQICTTYRAIGKHHKVRWTWYKMKHTCLDAKSLLYNANYCCQTSEIFEQKSWNFVHLACLV